MACNTPTRVLSSVLDIHNKSPPGPHGTIRDFCLSLDYIGVARWAVGSQALVMLTALSR